MALKSQFLVNYLKNNSLKILVLVIIYSWLNVRIFISVHHLDPRQTTNYKIADYWLHTLLITASKSSWDLNLASPIFYNMAAIIPDHEKNVETRENVTDKENLYDIMGCWWARGEGLEELEGLSLKNSNNNSITTVDIDG